MQDTTLPPSLPRIGLSQGDFNGISYELMLKTFSDARMFETFTPVLYGQSKVFSYYKKNFGMESPNYSLTRDARQAWDKKFNIINIVEHELKIEPGTTSNVSAEMSVLSMKRAADDLRNGILDALVMAPDSPMVAPSNRDFLLSFHKEADPMQVLVNGTMRIALATGDVPLRTALDQLDVPYLVGKLTTLTQALKTDFGISSPKIAVMGINPHSGSAPTGDDDKVVKAVKAAQEKGLYAFGPFSASQLFAAGWWKKYDAVMALHYEQGVFPMKFLSLEGYAYYWAGLPVVCAAPLHGPAYDIANQNKAVPDAYRKAIFLAADVVCHRNEQ
jgi:4-hydroxythreonine-4-phosphate dehydrogenase